MMLLLLRNSLFDTTWTMLLLLQLFSHDCSYQGRSWYNISCCCCCERYTLLSDFVHSNHHHVHHRNHHVPSYYNYRYLRPRKLAMTTTMTMTSGAPVKQQQQRVQPENPIQLDDITKFSTSSTPTLARPRLRVHVSTTATTTDLVQQQQEPNLEPRDTMDDDIHSSSVLSVSNTLRATNRSVDHPQQQQEYHYGDSEIYRRHYPVPKGRRMLSVVSSLYWTCVYGILFSGAIACFSILIGCLWLWYSSYCRNDPSYNRSAASIPKLTNDLNRITLDNISPNNETTSVQSTTTTASMNNSSTSSNLE
jgi:hypothetical protein